MFTDLFMLCGSDGVDGFKSRSCDLRVLKWKHKEVYEWVSPGGVSVGAVHTTTSCFINECIHCSFYLNCTLGHRGALVFICSALVPQFNVSSWFWLKAGLSSYLFNIIWRRNNEVLYLQLLWSSMKLNSDPFSCVRASMHACRQSFILFPQTTCLRVLSDLSRLEQSFRNRERFPLKIGSFGHMRTQQSRSDAGRNKRAEIS